MEIKNEVFDKIMNEFGELCQISSALIHNQDTLAFQNRLSQNLLNLSSHLAKNGLAHYATELEENIVVHILNAPYAAKQAFFTHKPMFAERHKMAMFLYEHLDLIRDNVEKRNKEQKVLQQEKIKVFTYWHSQEQVPLIIRICQNSFKKYIDPEKFELVILNEENYKDWVDFRKEHLPSGIGHAHFTDLLRMKLLDKWGGFWLDATCLLIGDFYHATQNIRDEQQFMFCYTNSRVGNWFIYSKHSNYILSMVTEALMLWFKKKGYLTNYFMTHDVIEMLYWIDDKYANIWDKMLKIHPADALSLLKNYKKTLSDEDFYKLLNHNFIHKLTYKYDQNEIVKDSSLDRILKDKSDQSTQKRSYFLLNESKIKNKTFVFSKKDGSFAREMCLMGDFSIKNVNNKGNSNECFWGIENNLLVLKNQNGVITSIFNEYYIVDDVYYIYGYFKNNTSLQFLLKGSID